MSKVAQFARNSLQGSISNRAGTAAGTTVQVAGLRELLKGLAELPEALGTKAVWGALSAAGGVVRRRAVELAPQISPSNPKVQQGVRKVGTVKRAIRVSRSKYNRGKDGLYEVIVRVKPLKGKARAKFKKETGLTGAQNPDDPYYWWWLEFGTSKMAARPFLRPAFNETRDAQLGAMRKRISAFLGKYARKVDSETRRAA